MYYARQDHNHTNKHSAVKKSAGLRALATWCLLLPFLYPVTGSRAGKSKPARHPLSKGGTHEGGNFYVFREIPVILDKNASAEDKFAAQELVRTLESPGIEAFIATQASGPAIEFLPTGSRAAFREQEA